MKKLKKKEVELDFSLPTERSVPKKKLSDYIILLYGQEKIGKTSWCAQFPKALVLLFEPGGKDLSIYEKNILNWAHFKGVLKRIEKDDSFHNVAFDTADVAYLMCEEKKCDDLGISDPSEEGYGKGWREIKKEFYRSILRLTKAGKGVIFTSHATEKQVKTMDGEVDRIVPTMSKQAREILEPLVDIWVYYRYRKTTSGEREFVIRGSDSISAGTRTENHFKGLSRIPAGKTAKEAYDNFVAAFENRLEVPKEPVKLLSKKEKK